MNKQRYRIIFNKKRGQLMAVGENAVAGGKSTGDSVAATVPPGTDTRLLIVSLRPLAFSMFALLGLVAVIPPAANAQVVAYRNAPAAQQATILNAGNGIPLVNIRTPSAAGVSHNVYSQFDVQQQGTILNNARTNAQTQLAGWVQGNPWLATGTARVILNEVVASNPSLLGGYVEVAGDRAQVVIANPAGVTCDGCGFINASRATLTTGTPLMNGGNLQGYRVEGGNIAVQGAGMDTSGTTQTDLIARAVQVNAGLWANDLRLSTGVGQVDAGNSLAAPIATGSGSAPAFALDVAALGGMYAGKITLVGTEAGVGVRNAGQIGASVGDVVVTADGQLLNSGTIYAKGQAALSLQGGVDNTQGMLAADGKLTLRAARLDNNTGVIGSLSGDIDIDTGSTSLSNRAGLIQAAQNLTLASGAVDNTDGAMSAHDLQLNSRGQTVNNTGGQLVSSGSTVLQSGTLINDGGLIQATGSLDLDTHGHTFTNIHSGATGGVVGQSSVRLATGDLNNNAGFIGAQGALTITGNTISNTTGGSLAGAQDLALSANNLDNRGGQIEALGASNLTVTGTLDNTASLIRSGQTQTISADRLINHDTLGTAQGIEGQSLTIAAQQVDNTSGALRANNTLAVTSGGSVDNSGGLISATQSLALRDPNATTIGNAAGKTLAITNTGGTLIADVALNIDSRALTGDGEVLSGGDLEIKLLDDFTHAGAHAHVAANGNTTLTTAGVVNNRAAIEATGALTVTAGTINNDTAGELLAGSVKLTATDTHTLTNRGLIDGVYTFIDSATVSNLGTGRIYGDHVAIAATTLTNAAETVGGVTSAPVIAARGRLDLGADTITNAEHGLLFSAGDLSIGGTLDADHHATGQATTLNNASATIESLGDLALGAQQINNTNEHLSTAVVTTGSEAVTEYQGSGAATRYLAGTPDVYIYNDESDHLHTPEGNFESWTAYRYTRSTSETQVTSSDPGRILAGGSISVAADTVNNNDSQIIAGGTLSGIIGTLNNNETPGERTIADAGSATSYWRDHEKGRDRTGSSTSGYHPPASIEAISLGTTVYRPGSTPSGTGTTLAARSTPFITEVASGSGAAGASIRTLTPNPVTPDSSLFHRAPDSSAHYLIETDPRFANYRTWISSDYMLQQLSLDPATTQKRLGDGSYEQRLLREQIAQLTGRRFLDGYANDEAQYQALMDAGITYAQTWHLIPGVALSAEQMAQLTTDMVWLVEQSITLADGSTQKALVPQIYARIQPGDLAPSGALIAANTIQLNLTGDLTNQGSIAGRQLVALTAENIHNLGGSIQATNTLIASAGHDLTVASTSRTQDNANGSRTHIDRVAGLYVTGQSDGTSGTLVASAGNDLTLLAAALINSSPTAAGNPAANTGTTLIQAGHDLTLGTIDEASSNHLVWDGKNHRDDASRRQIGSTIQATGELTLQAGHDLTATAASVTSEQGALTALAGNNLTLTAGTASNQVDEAHQHKEKGFLSSKTRTTRDTLDSTQALASTFSGNRTELIAGNDLLIHGSNAVASADTTLTAGHDLTIESATEHLNETHYKKTTQSGLFSSGGVGFTLGSRIQSTDQQSDGDTAAASTIGSTAGNVSLQAGDSYRQIGSDVIAAQGDIDITAKTVDIREARERSRTSFETKTQQTGLTLAITNPIISAIQTVQQMSEAASQTKDRRMQLLAAANVGLSGYSTYDAIKTGQGSTVKIGEVSKDNQIVTKTDANGKPLESRDANAADKVGGINLSISLGTSSSQSKTTQTSDAAAGSTVQAGGDLSITASGAGEDSDITVQGSDLAAGHDLSLNAEDELKLLAAANTADQHSTNKNSSASVGVSIGTDGLMFNIGASAGRGKADGADLTWTNTHVTAGDTLTLQSGGDTTLKGAVAQGEHVIADVGGDLTIESLQDQSTYDSRQKSAGFSLSIGYGKMSGSLSMSQSKVSSDYASVSEQSGIKAGDEGFQVAVAGDTDLKGSVIASSQSALDNDKNSFQTASLATEDIQNHAAYEAKSASLNIGSSMSFKGDFKPGGTGAGFGEDSDSADSTTKAGISGIAGNADVRTGDPETGIARIFDAEKVQKEIEAQTKITQMFGQQASKAVGDYAQNERKSLQEQLKNATTEEDKAALQEQIKEINLQERVMDVLIGAVSGIGASALTKETLSAAAEEMRRITIENSSLFKGVTDGSTTLTNVSGVSEGVRADGVKGGGTRVDLDNICGKANERCITTKDHNGQEVLDLKDGMVQWNKDGAEGQTLAQYLDSPQGQKASGATGGIQGWKGTLFGMPYAAGSWQDKLIEAFGGTHDLIGGQITGLYDEQGNTKRGMSETEQFIRNRVSEAALVPATPFAMAELLPPEVWKGISILLGAAK